MHIAILTNAYPPAARGGAGKIAEVQASLLRRAGHDVRVWHAAPLWLDRNIFLRLFFHVRDLFVPSSAWREIGAWHPDVLISHNLTGIGFRTSSLVQKKGVRWIHELHDVQLFEPSGRLRSSERFTMWQRAWSFLRRWSLGIPDVVISPTQWLLDEHTRRGFFSGAEKVVLPNPGPSCHRKPFPSGETLSCPPCQGDDQNRPLRILFVGRVSPDKGSRFLEDFIRSSPSRYTWTIVGAGEDLPRLQALEGVRCLGEKSEAEVLAEMERADVLLVPSQIVENQPTVLLEAFSRGLPIIAEDIGGVRETVGEAGILCSGIFARKCQYQNALALLENPETRQMYARRSCERWKRFDPVRYGEELVALVSKR